MTVNVTAEHLNGLISDIYDCAVDPAQWEPTLCHIRDAMDLAYVMLTSFNATDLQPGHAPRMASVVSPWDSAWLDRLPPLMPTIPHVDKWLAADLDCPASQMQFMTEPEFRATSFCRDWVAPQNLRDNCITALSRRDQVQASLITTTRMSRGLFDDADRNVLRWLSPHLRRALMISDVLGTAQAQSRLYADMLDHVAAGVFLVESDGRIVHANRAGSDMLGATAALGEVSGRLWPHRPVQRAALMRAMHHACTSTEADLGHWGDGVALRGADGSDAVAYVLPLGRSEIRHALGPGHAAVFVTNHAGTRPPSANVLSALSGLTTTEARVALAIAEGQPTETIATVQQISIHTLRKHLANIYDKTGLTSQSALGAFVNRLRPPVTKPRQ